MMSDNHWITNIYNGLAAPNKGGTFGQLAKWVGIGTLFLFTLRLIGEWF
jgi:hypothetical protein